MGFLESVYIGSDRNLEDFRFPVQYVNRPHLNFRGYCGTIASGIIRAGEPIMALPSRKTSRVRKIVTFDGDLEEAFAPQSVTLLLEDEIDVSRGDMLVRPGNVPRLADRFEAAVIWMAEQPMVPGKQYLFKQTTKSAAGTVSALRYQIDVNTLHRRDASSLRLNEIGRCQISLNQPIAFDGYRRNRQTGAFIIVDRITNGTVGAGMILDRATGDEGRPAWDEEPHTESVPTQVSQVTLEERQARFRQRPCTILLTGLTGSGKSTLAYAVERRLFEHGHASIILDGEKLRHGISKDLGFSQDDRSESLRRGAELARLMNDAGLICVAAFVAPLASIRERARQVVGSDRFLVVHLQASDEVRRQRDSAGHYAQADRGDIANFPGVSAPYEIPETPDLRLATDQLSVPECVDRIWQLLEERQVFTGD
jgi:bifunctional enzyme CysN/CysC